MQRKILGSATCALIIGSIMGLTPAKGFCPDINLSEPRNMAAFPNAVWNWPGATTTSGPVKLWGGPFHPIQSTYTAQFHGVAQRWAAASVEVPWKLVDSNMLGTYCKYHTEIVSGHKLSVTLTSK